ncbi:MAG: PilZ domain-containing protein [Planctomycetes bacterium]|nr:PilZ domain-containing protein [Planctomycetota bacterium]MBM3991638.1 PilZ domain-containing protein [Planctomycetota bacterium]
MESGCGAAYAPRVESDQRDFYRIEYPQTARPRLTVGPVVLEVLNLSESGVRFLLAEGMELIPGAPVEGELRFQDGQKFAVAGRVHSVQAQARVAALQFTTGVPAAKILQEQQILRQRYGR